MQKYKNITIDSENHIGFLNIIRENENNALNIETSKEIYEGLKELEINSSIRVILVSGNQKFFSPGADIKELNQLNSNTAKINGLFNFFDKIKEIKIPLIAAVEGYALGGGMELALLCDIIVASKEAKFSQPEINLGLVPGIGGTQRLKHYLGKHNANFLCMSGEIFTAEEASKIGLVSKILKKEDFENQVMNFVEKISNKPRNILIEIKKLISHNDNLAKGIKKERSTFYKLLNSENKKIGIQSFLKKIEPIWRD